MGIKLCQKKQDSIINIIVKILHTAVLANLKIQCIYCVNFNTYQDLFLCN